MEIRIKTACVIKDNKSYICVVDCIYYLYYEYILFKLPYHTFTAVVADYII